MDGKINTMLKRSLRWAANHVSPKNYINILCVLIGFLAGLVAVVIKYAVHFVERVITFDIVDEYVHYWFFLLPIIGVFLAIVFTKYILRQRVGHGIPTVLFALSKTRGKIRKHNMFSSIVTSALTVGFGGSVGLEGPAVATGAAIGSNIGKLLHFNFKQVILLLGAASAAAMAAIFKAPIAGVVFALEVIMIDMTLASVIPLLLASVTATLTSKILLGFDVLYPFQIVEPFKVSDILHYIFLGILSGFVALYFTKVYMFIARRFELMSNVWKRLLIGGSLLGALIFLFPALYGEGYEQINDSLAGNYTHLFDNTFLYSLQDNMLIAIGLIALIIFFKAIATSLTFGSGGIGGIFAPSLFLGSHLGLLFALFVNFFGLGHINNSNFAFAGMAGLIAANLHAPLTAIFLIGDITGGYEMFIPLMIVSIFAYTTVKIFQNNSIYTIQLAKRGELMTHNPDQNILKMMDINELIEKNFLPVKKGDTLGDLVKMVAKSPRNIFPVLGENGQLEGVITLNRIRKDMFKPKNYNKIKVEDLMYIPDIIVGLGDSMDTIANKLQDSGYYNIPVVENGKYLGFISKSNVFSTYRVMLKHFSED